MPKRCNFDDNIECFAEGCFSECRHHPHSGIHAKKGKSRMKTIAWLPKGTVYLLLLNGAIAVGFIIPFGVSIRGLDLAGIFFFSLIASFTGFSFYKQFNKVLFGFALLLAAVFSLMVFSTHESGALPVLWLIPFWLPIILMGLLKLRGWRARALASKIGGWMGILGVFVCFLGMGLGSGSYHDVVIGDLDFEWFVIPNVTGNHAFLVLMTIFSGVTLGSLVHDLRKRGKTLQVS